MWVDKLTEFSDAQDLDAETGTILATNQIDLSSIGRDIGNGEPLYLVMTVDEAFTDGGDSATLTVRLVSDDTASIHASTSTIHFQSEALVKTKLTLGATFVWVVPYGSGVTYEQFLGVNYVTATAGFDDGMVSTFLTTTPQAWKAYPDATN